MLIVHYPTKTMHFDTIRIVHYKFQFFFAGYTHTTGIDNADETSTSSALIDIKLLSVFELLSFDILYYLIINIKIK